MNTHQAGTIRDVLDIARWAPSGDNTQPWQFQVQGPRHAVVHGHDTRDHCVYDLDGWASQLSLGGLLETAAIGASAHGWRMQATRRPHLPDTTPTFDLHFEPDATVSPDPLLSAVKTRSVQRRPYTTRPLSPQDKATLQVSGGPGFDVRWVEGGSQRRQFAMLLFHSAKLRLITPEAYRVHHAVIEWGAQFSHDRVPDQALGVPKPMLAMMKTAMHSWKRVQFFNRYLAGTWLPRIQMDFWPAVTCAAHFMLVARQPARTLDDVISHGRALQRFWLTSTHLGLSLQPSMTPLIFARYAHQGRQFSTVPGTLETARKLSQVLARHMGDDAAAAGVFVGRIGYGPRVDARSLRKGLDELQAYNSP